MSYNLKHKNRKTSLQKQGGFGKELISIAYSNLQP